MMNIKIKDPIDEDLVEATFPFGSRVYGTAGSQSDYDYIKILSKSTGDLILQYQSGALFGIDYVYVDLINFIKLVKDGGNTPMFEVSRLPEFVKWYGWLPDFNQYKVAKAYLGLAKRDLDYPDRLFHVNRCLWMHNQIVAGRTSFDLTEIARIQCGTDVEQLREEIKTKRRQLNIKFNKI